MRNTSSFPLSPLDPVNPQKESQREAAASTASCCSGRPGAGAHACAREEAETEQALGKLARYYCATFGRRNCAPAILRTMREALREGMTPKVIALAMDAAAEAETPSWAYAAAVIRRCLAEGALTPAQFQARSAWHRSRRSEQNGKVPHAFNYHQREYQEEELEQLLFCDLDKYLKQD